MRRRIVVAITGASGTVYGIRALELLASIDQVETHLVVSTAARTTLGVETDLALADLEQLADHVHGPRDLVRTEGMLVAPCSIKSLSAIANSFSAELVARAADVTLKQRRPLVLMVRETPFHLGHLRLMQHVVEAGGIIFPPVPAFYNKPESLDDLVTHSVGRALEHLGVEVEDLDRWHGG